MNFGEINVKVLATKVDKREGYSLVFLKDSRKDKKSDKWIHSTYPNVHFAFNAHKKIDDLINLLNNAPKFSDGNSRGVFIILKSASLTNEVYEKDDGTKVYPKQLTVWDWEVAEAKPEDDNSQESVVPSDSSEDLPF